MRNTGLLALVMTCLAACGSPEPSASEVASPNESSLADSAGNEAERVGELQTLISPTYTPEQLSMICRAGIAAEFGRSHKIMRAKAQGDGLIRVTYNRPDDGKLWKSDCKVEGSRIVWRTVDAFGDNGAGRWRTGPDDDVLTFTLQGKSVTTDSRTGMSASETYRF